MASASAVRAGGAFIEVFLDQRRLTRGLRNLQRTTRNIGRSLTRIGAGILGVGATGAGGIAAVVREFAAFGDTVQKTAARTGFGARAISQYKFAAEQSGASLEVFEKAVSRMQANIRNLERGLSTSVESFGALGIQVKDLQGLSPEKQFETIAAAVSKIEDPSSRAAIQMEIFGRSGQKLGPLLAGGVTAMQNLRDESDALGLSLSQEQADAAAELSDAWNRAISVFRAVRIQVGSAVAPAFTALADIVAKMGKQVVDFVKRNGDLVRSFLFASSAITAIGAAILAAGATFTVTSIAIGGFVSVVGVVASAIALVVSPVGLLVTGLSILAVWLARTTSVVQDVRNAFEPVADVFRETFDAVFGSLKSGDLSNAINVLWAGARAAWFEGLATVTEIGTDRILAPLVDAFDGITTSIAKGLITGLNFVRTEFTKLIAFMTNATKIAAVSVGAAALIKTKEAKRVFAAISGDDEQVAKLSSEIGALQIAVVKQISQISTEANAASDKIIKDGKDRLDAALNALDDGRISQQNRRDEARTERVNRLRSQASEALAEFRRLNVEAKKGQADAKRAAEDARKNAREKAREFEAVRGQRLRDGLANNPVGPSARAQFQGSSSASALAVFSQGARVQSGPDRQRLKLAREAAKQREIQTAVMKALEAHAANTALALSGLGAV